MTSALDLFVFVQFRREDTGEIVQHYEPVAAFNDVFYAQLFQETMQGKRCNYDNVAAIASAKIWNAGLDGVPPEDWLRDEEE